MSFRRISLTALCCVLCATVVPVAAGAVVLVDCDAGDTISAALLTPDPVLEIEFSGTCVEDVLIARDDVILRGADLEATIVGVTVGPLEIRDASNIQLSRIYLTGGVQFGLKAADVRRLFGSDLQIRGNEQWGIVLGDGKAEFIRLSVRGNGFGAFAVGGGVNVSRGAAEFIATTIRDNTGNGAPNQRRVELQALNGATVTTTRGSIRSVVAPTLALEAPGDWAVWLNRGATLLIRRASFRGPFYLDDNSRLHLEDSSQIASTTNVVGGNSSLRGTEASSFTGPTLLAEFSNGTFNGGTDVDELDCIDASADALCDGSVTGTSSTCGLCPLP